MKARPIHLLAPALVTAILAAALWAPLSARAAFGPIELVSKSSREQAAVATEPALSADGGYIAFCAELGGKEGVFREQLETGRLTPVAVGPIDFAQCQVGAFNAAPYARAPSISAEGRYVSFTTDQALVESDTDGASDVYVADLDSSPPTYRLVSAPDGSDEPLPGRSLAAGRVALSADGNRVAFVNRGNVYVRELATKKTVLVSARRNRVTGMTKEAVIGGGAYEPAGAAISADGSTVAWVGWHLPEQVPLLEDEEAAIKRIEAGSAEGNYSRYFEPLWRRIPSLDDVAPPTRRIVGGGDPSAPGCPPSGTLAEPQCQGPYPEVATKERRGEAGRVASGQGWGVKLPQLDADGDEVALAGDPTEQYDLFVVDMREGLDRREAVSQVTQWTNPVPQNLGTIEEVLRGGDDGQYLPFVGPVTECAISPDGTRVAFTTTRQHFGTAPFTLVSAQPSAVSLLAELYELNLEADTIERATPGAGQDVSLSVREAGHQGAASPSFGDGDGLISFSSEAENLVAGDANESSDAFVVPSVPPAAAGTSAISPHPPQSVVEPAWRMTANAYSRPDGSVRVVALVPGPGTLSASARAQLGPRLKSLPVASARRRGSASSLVAVDLKLGRGRRGLARKPGLVTRIHVTFRGPDGGPLHADLQGRFLLHPRRRASGHRTGAGR